ncbi:outer membrane protein transport protein [Psychrobacter sp. APC 3281]|uniref:outer membrane protein transport protein n=1 Tax=Psychrobacter sp. APC 3281 TaxID=3035190 RepID=UPI0025B59BF6|nr:outer membrane protein transport protein [Psychrobacter sp. APC 3281]MDN3446831.1 outer membrane protein transport protein [Psychrobacter sp. APC 3281]
MRTTFHLKTLAVAIATLSIASMTNAAGLDRSGQDVTAFFQDGTYAEAVYTYIDADVSGYDSANVNPAQNAYERGNKTGDIAEAYDFFRYGVKTDINDTFSIGLLYDEPFGAAAEYTQSNFVANDDGIVANATTLGGQGVDGLTAGGIATAQDFTAGENTNVEVRSQSLTGILGMKFGANKNFQIYGGPVAQRIESTTKLRGLAYGPATGYTSNSNPDMDYGYIAGIAYSKPEIALKAALTYRSEIDHSIEISETYPIAAILGGASTPEQIAAGGTQVSNYEITTPKSVNFDFQTGINPTTLATAKVRWVPWSDFVITPPLYNEVSKRNYGPDGLNLVEYEDDQWQVELGLAKRVAPALAISGTVGWDSGAGDPTTSLGPVDGYYSVGLGAKYNVTENWAVSAGGKYLWFGDAQGRLPTGKIVGDFQDNDGYIAGVKLSYQGK